MPAPKAGALPQLNNDWTKHILIRLSLNQQEKLLLGLKSSCKFINSESSIIMDTIR